MQVRRLIEQQQILDAKPPMRLLVILEEDLLHRPVGGRLVLAAQLEHLGRVVERPHVNIRVVPRYTGWHPGLFGGFSVCQLRRPYPPIAIVEQLTGRAVLEADAANSYAQAFERLKENSLSHAESMALIATIAEETHAGTPPRKEAA
jgi:hypothetical protein